MNVIYAILGLLGLAAQVAIIYAFVRRPRRDFRGVFFYLLVLFLTTVADMAAIGFRGWPHWYMDYYYVNNTLRHFAGFVALVTLVYAVSSGAANPTPIRVKISLGTIAVIGLSLLLAGGDWPEGYMNEAARNLSFATVALTVVLWLSLMQYRTRDPRLFLVTGGLGLNMAGEAIGQSLVRLSYAPVPYHIASLIAVGSHLVCLYIWWKALRLPADQRQVPDGLPVR